MSDVQLSLIICTRNRASKLSTALASLGRLQTRFRWELIIVDNGSVDETRALIEKFRATFPQHVDYVYEPKPGLGNAHNSGLAVAQGDIIVFTDDDCYPSTDFLETTAQCFQEQEHLGYIGGRILLYDPTDWPITIQEKDTRQLIYPGSFIPAGLTQGANFAFRRAALKSVGGFDPWFGPGSLFNAEEVEFLARLSAAGWLGAYDPRPLVYHHHGRKTELEAHRLMCDYARGRGAYYTKCIMNPRLRSIYFRKWCQIMMKQDWRTTLREVAAGLEFLLRAIIDRGRRFSEHI